MAFRSASTSVRLVSLPEKRFIRPYQSLTTRVRPCCPCQAAGDVAGAAPLQEINTEFPQALRGPPRAARRGAELHGRPARPALEGPHERRRLSGAGHVGHLRKGHGG